MHVHGSKTAWKVCRRYICIGSLTSGVHSRKAQLCCGCSFDPERHLPPRSEGQQPFWNDWSVVFGAGDNSRGHSCAGELAGVLFDAWKDGTEATSHLEACQGLACLLHDHARGLSHLAWETDSISLL